jgi:hypothetical protein
VKPTTNEYTKDLKYLEMVDILSKKLENMDDDNFCKESLKTYLKEFANNNNVPFPDLMKTLRTLLSGLKVSNNPNILLIYTNAEMITRNNILGRTRRC